jgi:UDP-N-acetylmuramoylalanine--D-glutamate ligase
LIGNHINFFKKQIKGKLLFSVTKNLKNTIIKIREDKNLAKKNTNFILLSPAAASFDQFLNFEKRGLEFKKICKKYVKKFN